MHKIRSLYTLVVTIKIQDTVFAIWIMKSIVLDKILIKSWLVVGIRATRHVCKYRTETI